MIPGAEIIIGIAVQLIIAVLWSLVKLAVRAVRCCVIDHPLLTCLLFAASWQQGWLEVWFPELMGLVAWFPIFLTVLAGLGIMRACTPNHIGEARRFYKREIRSREKAIGEHVSGWYQGRVAERERVRNLPPPPVPPPTSPGPQLEQGTHQSVVEEAGQGVMDAFAGATPNAGGRPGEAIALGPTGGEAS
jgi:hypothetical protein